jgi:hypothetical protein
MVDKEPQSERPLPPKVTRRWLLTNLGVGAAEFTVGMFFQRDEEPYRSTFLMTGLSTIVNTIYDRFSKREGLPIVRGLGLGIGWFGANQVLDSTFGTSTVDRLNRFRDMP